MHEVTFETVLTAPLVHILALLAEVDLFRGWNRFVVESATLARAANVRLVAGKHEAYNDAETARGFFDALDACLGAGPRTESPSSDREPRGP